MYQEEEMSGPNDEFGNGPIVSPDDANQISDHIDLDGIERSGNPPSPSYIRYPPQITKHNPNITSSKDQLIFLPFDYQCSPHAEGPVAIYFQIDGASLYWEVQPASSSPSTGQLVLTLTLPGNIQNGTFSVNYRIKDDLGYTSNVVTTTIRVIDVAECNGDFFEGKDGLTVRSYDMGSTASSVRVTYDMFTIPDRIDIYYDGRWVGGTGRSVPYGTLPPQSDCSAPKDGYISGSGFFDIKYNPSNSRRIDVYVNGCLNSTTAWNVWVECF